MNLRKLIMCAQRLQDFSGRDLLNIARNWPKRDEIFLLMSGEGFSFLGIGHHVPHAFPDFISQNLENRVEIPAEISHIPFVGGWMLVLPYDTYEYYSFFADRVFVFDAGKNEGWILALSENAEDAENKIRSVDNMRGAAENRAIDGIICGQISSNVSHAHYLESIGRIKQKLLDGETYQVNFAQQFSCTMQGDKGSLCDPFNIFARVCEINPSPFQCYVQTPRFTLISNSPERLLAARRDERGITKLFSSPIKGTVPRGKIEEEDVEYARALLASEKDKAELVMIVDLVRNDLGKVCETGSVHVVNHRRIEKYSHVIHTVSDVEGILRSNCDLITALHAVFPGGSVTGCPKKRTMEIIRELEPNPRGFYTGSAGYISVNGNMDFNILIRTMTYVPERGAENSGTLLFHAGGGIVIDSDAEKEYAETLHKAAALVKSIGVGHAGAAKNQVSHVRVH